MQTCRFCFKQYDGTLQDHIQIHFTDLTMAGIYVAQLEERIKALEDKQAQRR
jgi:hypothetical protein